MSRKRKPGRPKGSSGKTKKINEGLKPDLDSQTIREVAAIGLFVFSFFIFLSLFGLSGSLGLGLYSGLRVIIGWTVFIVPFISAGLGYMFFYPEKYLVTKKTYFGLLLFLVSFSGMFHIFTPLSSSYDVAAKGLRGGILGHILETNILKFFNTPVSFVIFFALGIVAFIITTNKSIRSLFEKDREMDEAPKEDIRINDPTAKIDLEKTKAFAKNLADKGEMEVMSVKDDSGWKFPPIDIFEAMTTSPDSGDVKKNAAIIQKTLGNFSIEVAMSDVNVGPTVTQYTLKPQEGIKLSKITTLDKDLALSLAAHPIRIEAPIPGKSLVGVEVPNHKAAVVRMRDLLESETFSAKKTNLAVVLGLDVAGHPQVADITNMPHLLIAGSTGSGKSVCINTILASLLYQNSPSQLRLILVDPKRVELSPYNNIAHLLTPVIVDPEKTVSALKWAVSEMERRYQVLQDAGKRNITDYNATNSKSKLPYLVVVIDELADLMSVAASEVEALIVRIAQMARAVGIHLIVATQRPSVNVITGLIKANITTRVAFSVASQMDSRTILDQGGAEKLLGMGDMLFISAELSKPKRIQGSFISEKEVRSLTDFIKKESEPQFNEEVMAQPVRGGGMSLDAPDDDLFIDACDTVIRAGKASASLLQRRLRIGYARAARLLDLLEDRGVIGPADGARPRDVMVSDISEVLEDGIE